MARSKHVDIHTDGACLGNPGPGGYAAILVYGKEERAVTGGFRLTTNNRMEIMAAIGALSALKVGCRVTLYSDSQYLVNSMKGGFVHKWRAMGWKRNKKERAQNPDLWEQLLQLAAQHQISWEWVHGHRGHEMNERCDRLAVAAANGPDLAADDGYEREHPEARLPTPGCTVDTLSPKDEQRARRILAVLD